MTGWNHTLDYKYYSIFEKQRHLFYNISMSMKFTEGFIKKLQNAKLLKINPLTTNVPHHIETSQLICSANQLTGFYMMENIGR